MASGCEHGRAVRARTFQIGLVARRGLVNEARKGAWLSETWLDELRVRVDDHAPLLAIDDRNVRAQVAAFEEHVPQGCVGADKMEHLAYVVRDEAVRESPNAL